MRDRLDEFGHDTEVVLITFTGPASVDEYARSNSFPFTILNDPERVLYRAYGFGRGSLMRVWGWRSFRKYASLIREQGWGALQRSTEDTLQLGGDIVIAPDGTLAWGFWGEGPADRPDVDELIEAVKRANRV